MNHVPASSYLTAKSDLDLNLIEIVKSQAQAAAEHGSSATAGVSSIVEPLEEEQLVEVTESVAKEEVATEAPTPEEESPAPSPLKSPVVSPEKSPVNSPIKAASPVPAMTPQTSAPPPTPATHVVSPPPAETEDEDFEAILAEESALLNGSTGNANVVDDDEDIDFDETEGETAKKDILEDDEFDEGEDW